MAALILYLYLLNLVFAISLSKETVDRRFSDLKRCTDEECSMLMCRGKAAQDFSGPDCRFLKFKKGETIYVYYKLAGRRTDVWAGSVGSSFGYFPKDLLEINHIYTEKELEIPTEETDFVCFDSGLDKFDSYDLNKLLGPYGLLEGTNTAVPEMSSSPPSQHSQVDKSTNTNSQAKEIEKQNSPEDSNSEEAGGNKTETIYNKTSSSVSDKEQNKDIVIKDALGTETSRKFQEEPSETESHTNTVGQENQAIGTDEDLPHPPTDYDEHQNTETSSSDDSTTPNDNAEETRISQGEDNLSSVQEDGSEINNAEELMEEQPIPELLKTTMESTFDAVVSGEEETWKVTPVNDDFSFEENNEETHQRFETEHDESSVASNVTPLLSYSEDNIQPEVDHKDDSEEQSLDQQEGLSDEQSEIYEDHATEEEIPEDKSLWTTLGDTVFAIVSGGERTNKVTDFEDNEEEDDVEYLLSKEEEPNEDRIYLLGSEKMEDQEILEMPESEIEDLEQRVTNEHMDYESEVNDFKNESVSSENIAEVKSKVNGGGLKPDESALTADNTLASESAELSKTSSKEITEDQESAHDFEKSLHLQQKEIHAEKEETLKDRSMEELDGSQTKEDKSTHIGESDGSSQASEQHEEGTDLKNEDMVDQNLMKDLGEENVSKELEQRIDREAPKDVEQNGPEEYLKEIDQDQSDKTVAKLRKTNPFENEELFSEEKDKTLGNETTVEDTDEQMDEEKPQASNETVHESTDKSEIRETGEILEETNHLNAEETVEPELGIPNEEEDDEEELLEDENVKVAAAADFGTGTVDSNLNNTTNERGEEMTVPSKTEHLEIVKKVQSDIKVEAESQHVNNSDFKEAHNETDIVIHDDFETGKADDLVGIDSDIIERPAEKIVKLGITKPETDNIGAEDNSAGGEEAQIKENSGREQDGLEYLEANIPELSEKDSIVDPTFEIQEAEEPEYSDDVTQLTLLKGHFDEKRVDRFLKYLGPQHILRVEAMFQDLEEELKLTRQTSKNKEDIEKSLDRILESSETNILDEIEKMLDEREVKYAEIVQMDNNMFDEEAAVLDDFQEMAFHLRQKYSTASDSTPLAPGVQVPESTGSSIVEVPEANLTETNQTWSIPETEENSVKQEKMEAPFATMIENKDGDMGSDVGIKEDTHFERSSIKDIEDVQEIPETTTPKPLNTGFGFNMDHYLTGAPESNAVPDDTVIVDGDQLQKGLSGSWFTALGSVYIVTKECMGPYAEILVTALPEDWQPGPNFYGMPWEPVIITFLVGYFTFIMLLWRTLLAVKNRTYLLTEKQLGERIQLLVNEKCEVLEKISELKQKIEESEQQFVESEKTQSSSAHENEELKEKCQALQQNNEKLMETLRTLKSAAEEEKKKNLQQEERISDTQKSINKLQSVIQSKSAELSKVQTCVEEARVKEEAVKAELQSVLKENNTLKDSKKKLLKESRSWEEQHRELSEQIKTFQKSQKDLEDAVARKDNEIEVLSDCITELRQLETVELQKGDAKSNGETQGKKNDAIKNKIKLMTDVSRIKTTLTIVEEERDRYWAKLLDEENSRHQLEEQIQKLEHDHAALSSEKSHLENEFKTIQQKLEIMNELYQQKENALQQKLTQEEYERRDKEQKLSEVDGKAVQVVEELKIYKQRIQQIEEELQKTERSYKNQISSHEKKAHENWLNARAAERALVEEKRETANLRQKLVEVNDKLTEIQRPSLIKPTPGRQDRQIPPPRRGMVSRDDSYGPSPVSGGAPSPPPMIEGPGRPPSAPVGRREPFGHMDGQLGPRRPPSETSGRFHVPGEHGPPPPFRADVGVCAPPLISSVPRTSSPNIQLVGSMNTKAEGPPSFPGTPIMNSPASGPAPPPMTGPPNGHAPRPIAGHSLPAPGPRYGPPHPVRGPYGPRPYGPAPPLTVRGPPPPHRDYPPGSRDFAPGMRDVPSGFPLPHGPRDYPFPPKNMPSGTGPPPGMRDYPGPQGPPPHMGPRDYPPGPGVPPQQMQPRDFSSNSQNGP